MTYTPLIPPHDYPMFKDMKPKEAKEFFEWFVGEMDNRIEVLKQIVKEDGFNMKFDYSPESLIPLWEWYETKIKYIEKSEEEYKKDLEGRPSWMIPYVSKEKLSYETFNYGVDAAIYVARVFVNNSDGKLKIDIHKSKTLGHNEPTIIGFKNNLCLDILEILNGKNVKRSYKEKKSTRLLDFYNVWMDEYLF